VNAFSVLISPLEELKLYSLFISGLMKGPKQFQGLDPRMDGTKEDLAAASAKEAVEEGSTYTLDVDFEWVIRGFLTYNFPNHHGWKSEQDMLLAVSPSTTSDTV
jgi:hypothetical protein